MISVYVTGGNRKEKELIEKVAHWNIKKLMPRIRNLEIEISIKNLNGIYGDVMMADNPREYEMRVQRGMKLYDVVSTICHEMVHVKQYVRGELSETGHRWKSRTMPSDGLDYMDRPWEKEAFRMEEKLALECFKEIAFTLK